MGKAANQSLHSDNDLSNTIRTQVRNASPSATTMNNAWKKAKEEDPTLEFKTTFLQWRRKYEREYYKKRKAKNNK